jgi:tellurite resistance protein TerC
VSDSDVDAIPGVILRFRHCCWNPTYLFYLAFTAFVVVVVVLSLDLCLFHRKGHGVGLREATIWVGIWTAWRRRFQRSLLLFRFRETGSRHGKKLAWECLAGYLVEESLSVDNIFVFILMFRYFGIPPLYQHRILFFFGILTAIIFRGIFIALGVILTFSSGEWR